MTLSRTLVRTLWSIGADTLPESISAAARLRLLDVLGVGLASAGSPVGAHYRKFGEEIAHGGPATVIGLRTGAAAADAALVNGGLFHSLEYDDTHTASVVHPSCVALSAALAAGEAAGASGPEFLAAYVAGWETLVRLGLAAPGEFQTRGFQITAVGGPVAAALVGAKLFKLDENESVAALGISLSQASGVLEFLTNGSTVKSLHPGWAAHAGLTAARLARAGMTGPETALEGRFGFFKMFAGDARAADRFATQIGDLGKVWRLTEAAAKFYPCCHFNQPFVEAAGRLADRGINPANVESLVCRIAPAAAPLVCEPWERKLEPETPHEVRWSLPIIVASRLVDGDVTLKTFEEQVSAPVKDLARRITWEPLPNARYPQAFEAEIEVTTRSGAVEKVYIEDVYGNPSRPAEPAEVLKKFRTNASRLLTSEAIARVEAAVNGLAMAKDLKALSGALRSASRDGGER
jgi:2-methylcitrate dehydratase PrpD